MAARKKKATTKRALTVTSGGELAVPAALRDEFARYVTRDRASAVAAGWPYISTQGSTPVLSISGNPLGDARSPQIEAVILGGLRANTYYEGEFTPGKPASPICYAIADPDWEAGEVETKLAPPADLATKQSDTCAGCRWNAYGSGRGKAKACKNVVRLAMLPAQSDDYAKAEGYMLSVPPTSLSTWSSYITLLAPLRRPVFSVITAIEKIPNDKGAGFVLRFGTVRAIGDEQQLRAIMARVEGDGGAALVQAPAAAESTAKPATTQRRRKVVKKAQGKRR